MDSVILQLCVLQLNSYLYGLSGLGLRRPCYDPQIDQDQQNVPTIVAQASYVWLKQAMFGSRT